MMDWQDKLKALRSEMAPGEPVVDTDGAADVTNAADNPASHPRVDISLERKGRAGKTATLITGWEYDDEKLRQIASELKQKLGTGGSARGGDILIQGDYRTRLLEMLGSMGYKARII